MVVMKAISSGTVRTSFSSRLKKILAYWPYSYWPHSRISGHRDGKTSFQQWQTTLICLKSFWSITFSSFSNPITVESRLKILHQMRSGHLQVCLFLNCPFDFNFTLLFCQNIAPKSILFQNSNSRVTYVQTDKPPLKGSKTSIKMLECKNFKNVR